MEPEIEAEDAARPSAPAPILEVINVTKKFPNGRTVLNGISFEVFPEETFVILGGSGCGKSTLLNILIAVCCTVVAGIAIGVAIHPLRRVRRILDPLLSSYYALPSRRNAELWVDRTPSQFRFDIVKIDLALVQEGAERDSSRAVLRSLRDLAGRWGASVIAEGLETAAQLRAIREMGMTAGQGYLLARPMTHPDLASIDLAPLEQNHARLRCLVRRPDGCAGLAVLASRFCPHQCRKCAYAGFDRGSVRANDRALRLPRE